MGYYIEKVGKLRLGAVLTVLNNRSTKTIGGKTIRCGTTVGYRIDNITGKELEAGSIKVDDLGSIVISVSELNKLSDIELDLIDDMENALVSNNGGHRIIRLLAGQGMQIINLTDKVCMGKWVFNNNWDTYKTAGLEQEMMQYKDRLVKKEQVV